MYEELLSFLSYNPNYQLKMQHDASGWRIELHDRSVGLRSGATSHSLNTAILDALRGVDHFISECNVDEEE